MIPRRRGANFAIVPRHVEPFPRPCNSPDDPKHPLPGPAGDHAGTDRALMRLAIVRQDYRPEGVVERSTEPALEAMLERNVAISLYTRSSVTRIPWRNSLCMPIFLSRSPICGPPP